MPQVRSRLPKYGRIPKELLRDPDLSERAKVFYAMADDVSGHEPMPMRRIAGWLG